MEESTRGVVEICVDDCPSGASRIEACITARTWTGKRKLTDQLPDRAHGVVTHEQWRGAHSKINNKNIFQVKR